jgi:hypothetical protein
MGDSASGASPRSRFQDRTAAPARVRLHGPRHRLGADYRHLEIGPRAFGLAPGVPVTGFAAGVQVTLAGYVERMADAAARSIVTRLVVD